MVRKKKGRKGWGLGLAKRVLIDSRFIIEGNFSRVDYSNLMEYLTLDKLKLLIPCSKDMGGTVIVGNVQVQQTRKDYLENGVVIEYLSQHPNYVSDEGISYGDGKTFCCVMGPSQKEVDRVAEIILETQKNQDHKKDE